MYENREDKRNSKLIDEALDFEPIKNTFRLGWEFVTLNKKFTLTAMVTFILLNILGMIPMIALIFMVLSAIFGLAIQIHVGRTLYFSRDIQSYISEIEYSSVEAILNRHTATAFGVYMGWTLLILIAILIFTFIGGALGLIGNNMSEVEIVNALITLGLPIILVALVLSYVQPLVQANIILSNSFKEGFKAVFTIFSIELWRLSFQKSYFKYVAIFGTILIVLLFLFTLVIGVVSGLSGLAVVGNILLMMGMYIFMIMMSVGSIMAYRVVE